MKSPTMLAFFCVVFTPFTSAQQTAQATTGGIADPAGKQIGPAALEFSKPQLVEGVEAGSMIAGRFDCSEDGSVYTVVAADALQGDPDSHLAILAVHPGGTTTAFSWWSVPGLANVSGPNAIFAGNEHLYVLVRAESATGQNEPAPRYPTVLTFNLNGAFESALRLREDWNPLTFGVFPSGNILLGSEDRLNHRMGLSLVNKQGLPIREISLGENDIVAKAAQMPLTPRSSARYSPALLVAMSKFLPVDGHLLLVPFETGDLPIVELNELGVLRLTTPRLPADLVLEGLISSSSTAFTLRLGRRIEPYKETEDAQGKLLAVATEPTQRLIEFSREDGSILREIDLGSSGVQPACETNGVYRLLTSGGGKKLQVATAQLR